MPLGPSAINQAEAGIRPIFCYGSLMHPKVYEKVSGSKHPPTIKATLADYKRVCVKNEPFPAIHYQSGAFVDGLLVFNDSAQIVDKLDQFESDLYKRLTVIAIAEDQRSVACDVYVWNQDEGLLEDKEWDFEEFVRTKFNTWAEME